MTGFDVTGLGEFSGSGDYGSGEGNSSSLIFVPETTDITAISPDTNTNVTLGKYEQALNYGYQEQFYIMSFLRQKCLSVENRVSSGHGSRRLQCNF
jgi:hypothetical protein